MNGRRALRDDYRELPAYTILEAARYLSVPAATLRYWSLGRCRYEPLVSIPKRSPVLLSFLNLAELHVLAAIRRKYIVAMPKIRRAIEFLKANIVISTDDWHPLLSAQLQTDGVDLFVEEGGNLISISQSGQIAMREIIHAALQRIDRDALGRPVRFYPFTRTNFANAPTMIVIDPVLSGGRPVINGTGIATQIVAERYKAGESITELAHDYERPQEEIEEAIRCVITPRLAA